MDSSPIDLRLLNDYQRNFPLTARPFAAIADELGTSEAEVIERFAALRAEGKLARIGPVIRPHAVGASTLAAMAVPPDEVEAIATLIAARAEVNHCYEREHPVNLWFVVTAADETAVNAVLTAIELHTGRKVIDLPLLAAYHIDLGFPL
ncbi:MAG: Lrp/AsnC family transcriptional regulator [Rhodospirillales bacterium]|jgi:DNA-binding Lrp family transcriptional regulator|nr:Lrp/AsnC family transcriptional regulator [Rhodospirillales bacterium]